MDKIDTKIKDYLAKARQNRVHGTRLQPGYPTLDDFYLFIMDELGSSELDKMLAHLRSHPEDQILVSKARELLDQMDAADQEKVPDEAVRKAKRLMGDKTRLACPHCGKSITPFKKPVQNQFFWSALWLCLAGGSFALSFIFHRYFLQFLVLEIGRASV